MGIHACFLRSLISYLGQSEGFDTGRESPSLRSVVAFSLELRISLTLKSDVTVEEC